MFLPPINKSGSRSVTVMSFGGLNTSPKAPFGTMSYTKNLSSDAYPAIMPAKSRRKAAELTGISEIAAPQYTDEKINAFTGVKDNKFYYSGTKINGTLTSSGGKSIVDFNGNICIFPDKKYYRYLPDPVTGTVGNELKSMEKSVSAAGIVFYSSENTVTGAYTAYLQKTGAGFDIFSPGESIEIGGCSKTENNTRCIQGKADFASDTNIISAVVKASSPNRLDLLMYTKSGKKAVFFNTTESSSVTVKVKIPDMNHVCVHNNRLWGTSENGEYIYASKLGDCMNFNSFTGLGDDSWYSYIGTPGEFTGICSYRTSVVAFKRSCIHHVYGDSPKNFSIPKQTMTGCTDGRSIAELGGVLYYLSAGGFCAYSGGEPYKIAPEITTEYTACAAGADENKYYAAAYKNDGSCDVLVYDPRCNIWHREDNSKFLGFIRYGTDLYGATNSAVWEIDAGNRCDDWTFITNPFTYNSFEHKGPECIRLRIEASPGTTVKIEVSFDGGDFDECARIDACGFAVHRIPIRLKKCDSFCIRVTGSGEAIVHDLEMMIYQGGKTYAV